VIPRDEAEFAVAGDAPAADSEWTSGQPSPHVRRDTVELINAVLIAAPLGFFVRDRRLSLGAWLGIWAVVFPIQTVVVQSNDELDPLYFVFNAVFLVLGIGLNLLGAHLRRRRSRASQAHGVTGAVRS
jgi:hypothetical protein